MKSPFFSVIIPLYNKGKHVERTIRSVLGQDLCDFEIIVVDDGSTDDGPGTVEAISDPRIKLVRKENGGVSSARNLGAKIANGQFLAFLDADDVWEPQFTCAIRELIRQNPGGGAYGSDWYLENSATRITQKRLLPDGLIDFFQLSRDRSALWTSATVVPRTIFLELGGFDERLSHGEDIDLWFRIANRHKIYTLNRRLAVYVLDSENRACFKRGVDLKKRYPYYIPAYKGISNEKHLVFYYKYIIVFLVSLLNEGNYSYYRYYLKKHFTPFYRCKAVLASVSLLARSRTALISKRMLR